MTITPVHVAGREKGSIMLYALSTCIHCKQTKKLLDELQVAYDYLYVDQLSRAEMDEILKEIEKYNPRGSFPTLVINNSKVIVGSRLDEIREALTS
ncbi:MAG TPA: glutaredoxin family protein [Methanospirillum sp.]|uniref:glutaredoxin family protein n=1 Tax=Methanospirillum sp. TaxID=45200 RepID=UPI002C10EB29|nr:glutaredoxin family protein [Methanospirillum sp.]HOJ95420.1 glutaredoxin family protein [Methanospirillum sp.]HOL41488.1 glutaredoxin family protein [Methanospirillum sp.]HPP77281.1 glutaredoxin family protein [Methanospirillum sp.]